ncbi:MAG: hypothetical protein EZS28_030770 [Streblomastix strix]|uniref:Uncharacterized protein n=1 Tax=Streblomastix strix TaxID=222440 RepID=A0A5J4UTR2_9EUKA|nr:MAG: hypothetical protein EZS28_030770 [Streblomastix strix]
MQAISETKQVRKRQSKQVVPQLVEKQSCPIDEVLHAPLIDQSLNPIQLTQQNQEKIESGGRSKKYSSQEEAERIAAEQRSHAQQKYRIQRIEFCASANDLQLLLIRRLQKTVITNKLCQCAELDPPKISILAEVRRSVEGRDGIEKIKTWENAGQMNKLTV